MKQFVTTFGVLIGLSVCASNLSAQNLVMPGHSSATTQDLPGPGLTMDQVEKQFGYPSSIIDSVGEPPITQWLYAGFRVYFEDNRVIHCIDTDTVIMPR